MTTPITTDELPLPTSLDGPEGNDFRFAHELYNMVRAEGLGPAADADQGARVIAFLLSDAADHISGTEMLADAATSLLVG